MATHDKTKTGALLGVAPHMAGDRVFVMSNELDLTAVVPVAADIYQILAIPAGVKVVEVDTVVLTSAAGTSLLFDVGDGTDPDGWDANVETKQVTVPAYATSINGTDALAEATTNGTLYTTADSIDLKVDTVDTITAGCKIQVNALCIDYR